MTGLSHNMPIEQADSSGRTHVLAELSRSLGLKRAREIGPREGLEAKAPELDLFLNNAISTGSMIEWGMPFGMRGREVVLLWLAEISQRSDGYVLWVDGSEEVDFFAPAWKARGVDLEKVRFVATQNLLEDLRPAFIEPAFKMIVLDRPHKFSTDDCAFVASWARRNGQVIFLLRDWFLSSKRGNTWARLRLNCHFEKRRRQFRLQVVRGCQQRVKYFDPSVLLGSRG